MEGIRWLLKGVNVKKNNIPCFIEIGNIYERHGYYDMAVKHFIEGRKKFPLNYNIYKRLLKYSQYYNRSNVEIEKCLTNYPLDPRSTSINEYFPIIQEAYKDEDAEDKLSSWITNDLYELKTLCNQHNIKLIVMNYPLNYNYILYKRVNNAIRKFAITNNVTFIDNESIFMQYKSKSDSLFERFDIHCNANGYNLMAQNIYSKMIDENLIENRIK
jgi:hypothetical protein